MSSSTVCHCLATRTPLRGFSFPTALTTQYLLRPPDAVGMAFLSHFCHYILDFLPGLRFTPLFPTYGMDKY
jgi:hypothetical protein